MGQNESSQNAYLRHNASFRGDLRSLAATEMNHVEDTKAKSFSVRPSTKLISQSSRVPTGRKLALTPNSPLTSPKKMRLRSLPKIDTHFEESDAFNSPASSPSTVGSPTCSVVSFSVSSPPSSPLGDSKSIETPTNPPCAFDKLTKSEQDEINMLRRAREAWEAKDPLAIIACEKEIRVRLINPASVDREELEDEVLRLREEVEQLKASKLLVRKSSSVDLGDSNGLPTAGPGVETA